MNASSSDLACRASISSSGVPAARTLPACISEMRSQRSASFMKCVERKIVTPSLRERSIRYSQNPSRATGSTPDVGSSRISISGRCWMATANCRRWRMPSGRLSGSTSATSRSPNRSSISSTRLPRFGDREIEQLGVELEVPPHRELAVEREGLRHVADAPAHRHVPPLTGSAEQHGLAFGRRQKAGQHLHGRGLAAAVRAEKAEDLALLDAKAHVIDRDELVETLGEPVGFDRRRPALMLARRNLNRLVALALLLRQKRDERRLEVLHAGALLDLGRRARRDHVAAVHGREPRVLVGFLHVGGRDHHAHLRPPSADAVDQLPELPPRQRVDARRRLVQDQEIGIVDQRAAERQLLLHAAGELAGGPLEERVEAGRAGQIVDARFPLRLPLAEQPADEVQVFEHAERRVEIAAEALRHVGDARDRRPAGTLRP